MNVKIIRSDILYILYTYIRHKTRENFPSIFYQFSYFLSALKTFTSSLAKPLQPKKAHFEPKR